MKTIISRLLVLQDLQLQTPSAQTVTSEIETLRGQIPGTVLDRFDKFIVRGKKGVALVQNGVCRGCQIALPIAKVNELINGNGSQVCGNCGRYLSLPEADAALFQAGKRTDTIVVSKPKVPTAGTKTSVTKTPKRKSATKSAE